MKPKIEQWMRAAIKETTSLTSCLERDIVIIAEHYANANTFGPLLNAAAMVVSHKDVIRQNIGGPVSSAVTLLETEIKMLTEDEASPTEAARVKELERELYKIYESSLDLKSRSIAHDALAKGKK